MNQRKKFRELTIKDNFMFSAVMLHEDICREFLEMTLGFPISHVEVSSEKAMAYHSERKGVRLDIYARDENNTRYNVEMQVARKSDLARRSRYYHSQMDMEALMSGDSYDQLPNTYVIFICNFDPFGLGRYRYTFTHQCLECDRLSLNEGCKTIFLNTFGKNDFEVPQRLAKFLKYVRADVKESMEDFGDSFVGKIQNVVLDTKRNREMEERFMLFDEWLKEECMEAREEARAEGLAEGLAEGRAEGLAEGQMLQLIRIVSNMQKRNKNPEDIASELGENADTILLIFETIKSNDPDCDCEEIYSKMMIKMKSDNIS